LLQSILVLIVPRFYAMLPSVLFLGVRFIDTMAVTLGWKRNFYVDDAILHRVSPQMPDSEGQFHAEPAQEKVVIFLLGAKSNHPMGLFAPNFKKIGDHLNGMIRELDSHDHDHELCQGYLGGSSWTCQDKNGATEFLWISYWRAVDDVHRYAAGPLHRAAWDWWHEAIKENDHIGINHEIFEAAPGHWESVYLNFQPTMLGATTFLRKGDKLIGGTVDDQYLSPLVDARRGKLRTSAGRLGGAAGGEHDEKQY
jgi:heme-degrading monooxygenase HmoA